MDLPSLISLENSRQAFVKVDIGVRNLFQKSLMEDTTADALMLSIGRVSTSLLSAQKVSIRSFSRLASSALVGDIGRQKTYR
jgi:hypothetical protein